jgi:ribonuclease HI
VSPKQPDPDPLQPSLPFQHAERPQPSAETLVAYVDGGSRGNPGEAGAGIYLERLGSPWRGLYEYLGRQTNNYAEYSALLCALDFALHHGFRKMTVYADSELLVRQMTGQYKVRNAGLLQLHARAQTLARRLDRFAIHHIRREQNRKADALANRAQDLKSSGEEHYDG